MLAQWAGPAATVLVIASMAIVAYAAIRRGLRAPLLILAFAAILLVVETSGIRHLEGLLVIAAALLTARPPRRHCNMKGAVK